MKSTEPMDELRALVDTVKVGFLSTLGIDGYPHTRWMTTTMLPGEHRFLYCVSMAGSRKVADIQSDEKVTWSFQAASINKVVTINGSAVVLDNPQLKAEVLEVLGPNLSNFWRINPDPGHLIVIETAIEHVSLYLPAEGTVTQTEAQA
ncbi:MAG: hypothetical protein A2Y38_10980 [Spirochaetes bacterium GWB1_59_5]|nr:MAG: hypothetical protein A2Y38_10980 [Spirochaetes bacterium GWB1_59_5]